MSSSIKSIYFFSELKHEIENYIRQGDNKKCTFTVYKSYLENSVIIKGTKIEIDNDDKLQKRVCDIFPEDINYIYIEVNRKAQNKIEPLNDHI